MKGLDGIPAMIEMKGRGRGEKTSERMWRTIYDRGVSASQSFFGPEPEDEGDERYQFLRR
jgi:hypothetical protein